MNLRGDHGPSWRRPAAVATDVSRPLLLAWGVYLALQVLTFRTGAGFEEFRDLWVIRAIAAGRLPMRDFVFEYGPAGPFVWYAVTRVTGVELFWVRLISVLLGLLGMAQAHSITKRFISDDWAAGSIAFCAFGIWTFPFYSYTHTLSVITLLAALSCGLRAIDTGRGESTAACAAFSVLTLFVRPVPTGIALVMAVPIGMAAVRTGDCERRRFFLTTLFAALVVLGAGAGVVGYSKMAGFPLGRWASIHFGRGIPGFNGTEPLLRWELPHLGPSLRGYLRDALGGDLTSWSMLRNTAAMFNLLGGQVAYVLAFLLPAVLFARAWASRLLRRRERAGEPGMVLLSACAVGLGLLYHSSIVDVSYPDFAGHGSMWNWVGGSLLQPGLIVGLVWLNRGLGRLAAPAGGRGGGHRTNWPRLAVGAAALFLATVPKVQNLRFLAEPMPTTARSGVRWLLLNHHFRSATLPAIDYLWAERGHLPERIFSPLPVYLVLAPQQTAFPEYYYMGLVEDHVQVRPRAFPGAASRPVTAAEFVGKRLAKLRPLVVVERPLGEIPRAWARRVEEGYVLQREFETRTPIDRGRPTRVLIYVPAR